MKSVAVAEFKSKCLALIEQVRSKKEKLLITKRGEPVAEVIPFKRAKKDPAKTLHGTLLFEKDILSPIDEEWKAQK